MERYINDILEECDVYEILVGRTASQRPESSCPCRRRTENVLAQIYITIFYLEAALEIRESPVCQFCCPRQTVLRHIALHPDLKNLTFCATFSIQECLSCPDLQLESVAHNLHDI